MASETDHLSTSGARRTDARFGMFAERVWRSLGKVLFSSIARRILILNLAALGVLMSGILYLNQFREGLIDARVESLMTQGEIIAGAIAASASVETDALLIDPEKLLELEAGETIVPNVDTFDSLDFPLNPERIAPVLRRLISPTRTRARVYDRDANLVVDSRHLYSRGQILRYELPELDQDSAGERMIDWFTNLFRRRDLPVYREEPGGSGAGYPEVIDALSGGRAQIVRISERGEMIVSIAVPVQRFRAVLGVLQLSTQGGDIDNILRDERLAMIRVFSVAVLVNIVLSILLAGTIATPLRRLSEAAVRVRRSVKMRANIPDFSARSDEIGDLSAALRDMTVALYARIDAIESFAADVSHELKNPLTSLRSAVETLPLAKNEEMRGRLLNVIEHDVRRLDRLISDISDASRLDAELAREDAEPVDMQRLLKDMVPLLRHAQKRDVEIAIRIDRASSKTGEFFVAGHELRLGQVLTNLVDNAASFVPEKTGRIDIVMRRDGKMLVIDVEDNGPGIRADSFETIFQRFYTDRGDGSEFGKNSGLGLSISRQIVEAHGGTLTAVNRSEGGARFTLRLPAEG